MQPHIRATNKVMLSTEAGFESNVMFLFDTVKIYFNLKQQKAFKAR